MAYRFRLVNVFASEPLLGASALAGNPLCVFEDARGLDDRSMMALTRQFAALARDAGCARPRADLHADA